jgi:hypothetical protein
MRKFIVQYERRHYDHMPVTLEFDTREEAERQLADIREFPDLRYARLLPAILPDDSRKVPASLPAHSGQPISFPERAGNGRERGNEN